MSEDAPHVEPKEEPGIANAEEGHVILDGPDGVAVTMTPDAATETANSLMAAAERARGQQGGDSDT